MLIQSQERLTESIEVFLGALAVVDANKIVTKSKCHSLTHIVDDIRRFGPAVGLSTDTFESFNGVVRLCSVLSNRHAPSRDIGLNMSDMARFKHITSGGLWKDEEQWVNAGDGILDFFHTNETLHRHLGWTDAHPKVAGLSFLYLHILIDIVLTII